MKGKEQFKKKIFTFEILLSKHFLYFFKILR